MLHNVIEGLCIATGLPKPKVYIVDDPAPNAFAFGRSPKNSGVAVTSGLLNLMSRRELEGVLAHEMSHVRNRDVQVSTLAVTTVGVLVAVAEISARGSFFAELGRRRRQRRRRVRAHRDRGARRHPRVRRPAAVVRDLASPGGAGRHQRGRARLARRVAQGTREARGRPHRRAPRVARDRAPLDRRAARASKANEPQGARRTASSTPTRRSPNASRSCASSKGSTRTSAAPSTRRSPACPSTSPSSPRRPTAARAAPAAAAASRQPRRWPRSPRRPPPPRPTRRSRSASADRSPAGLVPRRRSRPCATGTARRGPTGPPTWNGKRWVQNRREPSVQRERALAR